MSSLLPNDLLFYSNFLFYSYNTIILFYLVFVKLFFLFFMNFVFPLLWKIFLIVDYASINRCFIASQAKDIIV